mgnify:CR=1 FL=1
MASMQRPQLVPCPETGGSHPVSIARLLQTGQAGVLNDHELLAAVLRPGAPERALAAASAILASPNWMDPAALGQAPWRRMLSPVQTARLLATLEAAERWRGDTWGAYVKRPEDVALVVSDIRRAAKEYFVGLYLNTRHRLLCRETVSVGSLNASIVHPREVFLPALRAGAAAVIVVHNHPSGETDPSEDDIAVTRRLVEAGEILGIGLLDHIIVGERGHTSLKELGHL